MLLFRPMQAQAVTRHEVGVDEMVRWVLNAPRTPVDVYCPRCGERLYRFEAGRHLRDPQASRAVTERSDGGWLKYRFRCGCGFERLMAWERIWREVLQASVDGRSAIPAR